MSLVRGRDAAQVEEAREASTDATASIDPARPLRGATWLFSVIAIAGGLHLLGMIGVEAHRYFYNRGEIIRLEADIAALDEEIADLQAILLNGRDERFREQLARLHGFVYPDEMRLVTVPER